MEGSIYKVPHVDEVLHIVEGNSDLETLIVALMQTLKSNNKKRGKVSTRICAE